MIVCLFYLSVNLQCTSFHLHTRVNHIYVNKYNYVNYKVMSFTRTKQLMDLFLFCQASCV